MKESSTICLTTSHNRRYSNKEIPDCICLSQSVHIYKGNLYVHRSWKFPCNYSYNVLEQQYWEIQNTAIHLLHTSKYFSNLQNLGLEMTSRRNLVKKLPCLASNQETTQGHQRGVKTSQIILIWGNKGSPLEQQLWFLVKNREAHKFCVKLWTSAR